MGEGEANLINRFVPVLVIVVVAHEPSGAEEFVRRVYEKSVCLFTCPHVCVKHFAIKKS